MIKNYTLLVLLFTLSNFLKAQTADLSKSTIVCFEKTDKVILKSVTVLQEEIAKRTGITLPVSSKPNKSANPVIYVGLESQAALFPQNIQQLLAALPKTDAEGYKIVFSAETKTAAVTGTGSRGVLYGVGKLLRSLEMEPGKIILPAELNVASSPKYPIRGHQIGFRPKTNAYDAWTPAQFDQYIRDLVVLVPTASKLCHHAPMTTPPVYT